MVCKIDMQVVNFLNIECSYRSGDLEITFGILLVSIRLCQTSPFLGMEKWESWALAGILDTSHHIFCVCDFSSISSYTSNFSKNLGKMVYLMDPLILDFIYHISGK